MIYGVIPARSGSKGVPNKNVKILNGLPLMFHSLETAISSQIIDKIYVTTDSKKYGDLVNSHYANIDCILRPEHLSNDTATDIDYLLHLAYVTNMTPEDYIILLRPTTPTRNTATIDKIIQNFVKEYKLSLKRYTSLRSMHKISESPDKMYKIKNNQLKPYIDISPDEANKPRQSFSDCFQPNGYIDIISCEALFQRKMFIDGETVPYITDRVIEIDDEMDFKILKALYGEMK